MASGERLFVVGPLGSGVTTALNFIERSYSPAEVVVPKLITSGDISSPRDPRIKVEIPAIEFDLMLENGDFEVAWIRYKGDISPGVEPIRHALPKLSPEDTRLRVYNPTTSIFKVARLAVEEFVESGEALLTNATWEARKKRLARWLPEQTDLEGLMRWHDSRDDEYPLGYVETTTIDTSHSTDDQFYEKIVEFIRNRYGIVPNNPAQMTIRDLKTVSEPEST